MSRHRTVSKDSRLVKPPLRALSPLAATVLRRFAFRHFLSLPLFKVSHLKLLCVIVRNLTVSTPTTQSVGVRHSTAQPRVEGGAHSGQIVALIVIDVGHG